MKASPTTLGESVPWVHAAMAPRAGPNARVRSVAYGVEESTRGAFVRAATAAAADADPDEALVLEEALRYGLMALSGAEVGLR